MRISSGIVNRSSTKFMVHVILKPFFFLGALTCWYVGRASTPLATPGSRWRTSPIVRRPSRISSGPGAFRCPARPPRPRRWAAGARRRRSLPAASRWRRCRRRLDRSWSGGASSTYLWPEDGWQLGTVARVCTRAPFTHVVAYHRRTSALSGTVDTALNRAAYGSRWVLLAPAPSPGVVRVHVGVQGVSSDP